MVVSQGMNFVVMLFQLLTGEVSIESKGVCTATIFGYKNDKWAGGNALHLGRKVNSTDYGMAHRTLPMGTTVIVKNQRTGKLTMVEVIDRGPYGAIVDGPLESDDCREQKDGRTWCIKLSEEDPGDWKACIDLTPAAAKALGHDGFDSVRYWRVRRMRK